MADQIAKFLIDNSEYISKNKERFRKKTISYNKDKPKNLTFFQRALRIMKAEDKKTEQKRKGIVVIGKRALKANWKKALYDRAQRAKPFKRLISKITPTQLIQYIKKHEPFEYEDDEELKGPPKMQEEHIEEPELEEEELPEREREYEVYISIFATERTKDSLRKIRKDEKVKHIKVNGKYFQEFDDDWLVTVHSKYNLETLLHSGQLIHHYEDDDNTKPETKEFKLVEKYWDNLIQNRFHSQFDEINIIRIDAIRPVEYAEGTSEEEKQRKRDLIFTNRKNRGDIEYESVKRHNISVFNDPFEENPNNFIEGGCAINIIEQGHGPTWKFKTFTIREHLQKCFKFKTDEEIRKRGLTHTETVECYYSQRQAGYVVLGEEDELIFSYRPEKYGCVTPNTLYVRQCNGHLELINNPEVLHKLQKRFSQAKIDIGISLVDESKKTDADVDNMKNLKVGSSFHIVTKYVPKPHLFLDTIEQLQDIDLSTYDKNEKTIQVTVREQTCNKMLLYLRDQRRYIPSIKRQYRSAVSSLTITKQKKTVEISSPLSNKLLEELNFQSNEQYDEYHRLKFEVGYTLMNPSTVSTLNDIDLLSNLAPKALSFCLNPDVTPNYLCDISGAYFQQFMRMNVILVQGEFDKLKPYNNEKILPNSLYKLGRTVPFESLPTHLQCIFPSECSVYYGRDLIEYAKDIQGYSEIISWLEISNTQSAEPLHEKLREVADNEILTKDQKKHIYCSASGSIEKTKNKNGKCILFEDREEARYYAIETGGAVIEFLYTINSNDAEYIYQVDEDNNYVLDENFNCIRIKNPFKSQVIDDKNKPQKKLWMLRKDVETQLDTGFYVNKIVIYSGMRFTMMKLCKQLIEMGAIIHSIKTDCFYFYYNGIIKENFGELKAGEIKWRRLKEDSVPPRKPHNDILNPSEDASEKDKEKAITLRQRIDSYRVNIVPEAAVEIPDEIYWKTDPQRYYKSAFKLLNDMLEKYNYIHIKADLPGCGKSTLSASFQLSEEAKGKRILATAFNNKRVRELRSLLKSKMTSKFLKAYTLHKLLKLRVTEDGESIEQDAKDNTHINLKNYDILFIDETAAFPPKLLAKISKRIMKNYPHLKILACGDVEQSRVCPNLNVKNINKYYSDIIQQLFPHQILLRFNKRMDSEEEVNKLLEIKQAIFSKTKQIPYVKTFNTLQNLVDRHINEEGKFTGAILSYFRDEMKTISEVIHTAVMNHEKNKDVEFTHVGDKYLYEGLELIYNVKNKPRRPSKSGKNDKRSPSIEGMFQNCYYTVGKIYQSKYGRENVTIIEMFDEDNVKFNVKESQLESFHYPYVNTIHSSQGDTYKNMPLSIFDFNNFRVNENDKWTAISRTNRIELVQIYNGPNFDLSEEEFQRVVNHRIESHKREDTKKNRVFTDELYVDYDWVKGMLILQKNKCIKCGVELSLSRSISNTQVSIDRKDNRFSHLKSNCDLSCRYCNITKKKLNIE